jgi:hypothetical protein
MTTAILVSDLGRQLHFQQVLEQLRSWRAYEQVKWEEWFEVEDAEMIAYHRGYERGLERSITIIEAVLEAADTKVT